MKHGSYVFILIGFTIFVLACRGSGEKDDHITNGEYDFRKTRWGMTLDQVKSSELNKPEEEKENILTYKEKYLDIPVLLGYIFAEGKLVKAGYIFRQGFYDPDQYIDSYEKVKLAVMEDLGPPMLDEIKWLTGENDEQKDYTGQAVCQGELLYLTNWVSGDTFVYLRLDSENSKCRQGLIYESTEYKSKENEAEQK